MESYRKGCYSLDRQVSWFLNSIKVLCVIVHNLDFFNCVGTGKTLLARAVAGELLFTNDCVGGRFLNLGV